MASSLWLSPSTDPVRTTCFCTRCGREYEVALSGYTDAYGGTQFVTQAEFTSCRPWDAPYTRQKWQESWIHSFYDQ